MSIDKQELSKFSPLERIKKLKLLEEERKKEADEIEQLIKKSMQELKTEKIAEEIAPELRPVDISSRFAETGEQRLERTAREEAPATALMKGKGGYQTFSQAEYDYSQAKKFSGFVSMGYSLTQEQVALVDEMGARRNVAERPMPVGEKLAKVLDASRMVLEKYRKEVGFG